jgi:succinate dehydrogenase hydrophobic anchor subunit
MSFIFPLLAILAIGGGAMWVIAAGTLKGGKNRLVLNIIVVVGTVAWLLLASGVFSHAGSVPGPKAQ